MSTIDAVAGPRAWNRVRPRWRRPRPLLAVSVLGLFVLWQVASALAGANTSGEAKVPSIVDVVGSVDLFADYWKGGLGVEATRVGGETTWQGVVLGLGYNVGLTAYHVVAGLVLGIAVGLAVAIGVSWSALLRDTFAFPAHAARMLPLLAMAPLFALWFGDSDHGAILFTAFTAFALVFPIALNAIGNVPDYYAQYARSLGESGRGTYVRVVLPAALPEIRSGVVLAVGFGWSAAIAAEYIGHEYGLGHVVKNAEFFGRTDLLGLTALLALALAAASFLAVSALMSRATGWSED